MRNKKNKMLFRMKKGVSFVEVMVVAAIMLILMLIALGAYNPIKMVNRGRDSQRKKDVARIKLAFEEYYNDNGCYPNQSVVDLLMVKSNCRSSVFSPWLNPWSCDPNGNPYQILVGDDNNCPKWYRIMALLENTDDSQISDQGVIDTTGETIPANYSASSQNAKTTSLFDYYCWQNGCYYLTPGGSCNWLQSCSGGNCFSGNCLDVCKVNCCGNDCN